MSLSWYNGFSPKQREDVQAYLNRQWAAGHLPRPVKCVACAQTEGAIHGHLENYDLPDTYVPLCITCHLVLHCRYRHRAAWEEYRHRVTAGWQAPPLGQREAFGVIRSGILANRWPDGAWIAVDLGRAETYLDSLPLERINLARR